MNDRWIVEILKARSEIIQMWLLSGSYDSLAEAERWAEKLRVQPSVLGVRIRHQTWSVETVFEHVKGEPKP